MSLLDFLRALRRFAIVFVLILIATAGAGYFVWTQVPLTYQSDASMVVLPPNRGEGPDGAPVPINPYQSAGDQSTVVAADALASVVNSPEFQARLSDAGVTSDTTIEVSLIGEGVILALTASNPQRSAAKADLTALTDLVSLELRSRQLAAGAPESTLLTADVLIVPNDATALATDRTKVVGAVLVIGVLMALVAVIVLEILRSRSDPAAVSPDSVHEDDSGLQPVAQPVSMGDPAASRVPEPLTVTGPALAAMEQAPASPRPRPRPRPYPQPQSVNVPSDDQVQPQGTVGGPRLQPRPVSDHETSSPGRDDDTVESPALNVRPAFDPVAASGSAASKPAPRREGPASRESTSDANRSPLQASRSSTSAG